MILTRSLLRLPSQPSEWIVCFTGRNNGHWLSRLLAPGYRHVWLFGYVPVVGTWLQVDPTPWGVKIDVFPGGKGSRIWQRLLAMERLSSEMLLVPAEPVRRTRRLATFYSCVSPVAGLLGVEAFPWMTPRRLARILRRRADVEDWRERWHGRSLRRRWQQQGGDRPGGGEPQAC